MPLSLFSQIVAYNVAEPLDGEGVRCIERGHSLSLSVKRGELCRFCDQRVGNEKSGFVAIRREIERGLTRSAHPCCGRHAVA